MEHNILISNPKKGFTLLELLIVIAIIGILISVGVVSYSSAQRTSRDSRRRSDMKAVQAAFEQYYSDNNGSYPANSGVDVSAYLPVGLPKDPKNVAPFVYSSTYGAASYCFCADLESGTGNSSNTSCSYGAGGSYFCVSNLQ
jgi:prepilin-type N-terminal cleavage/methylation domain-containing protein